MIEPGRKAGLFRWREQTASAASPLRLSTD
jgi:hypothetical protein